MADYNCYKNYMYTISIVRCAMSCFERALYMCVHINIYDYQIRKMQSRVHAYEAYGTKQKLFPNMTTLITIGKQNVCFG